MYIQEQHTIDSLKYLTEKQFLGWGCGLQLHPALLFACSVAAADAAPAEADPVLWIWNMHCHSKHEPPEVQDRGS